MLCFHLFVPLSIAGVFEAALGSSCSTTVPTAMSFRSSLSVVVFRRPIGVRCCVLMGRDLFCVFLTKDNFGRRFWGCVYYNVHQECSFFRWADTDSEAFVAEIGKLQRKVEVLKSKAVASAA